MNTPELKPDLAKVLQSMEFDSGQISLIFCALNDCGYHHPSQNRQKLHAYDVARVIKQFGVPMDFDYPGLAEAIVAKFDEFVRPEPSQLDEEALYKILWEYGKTIHYNNYDKGIRGLTKQVLRQFTQSKPTPPEIVKIVDDNFHELTESKPNRPRTEQDKAIDAEMIAKGKDVINDFDESQGVRITPKPRQELSEDWEKELIKLRELILAGEWYYREKDIIPFIRSQFVSEISAEEETRMELEREEMVTKYINSLTWSADTSDYIKTLVAGNIRAAVYKFTISKSVAWPVKWTECNEIAVGVNKMREECIIAYKEAYSLAHSKPSLTKERIREIINSVVIPAEPDEDEEDLLMRWKEAVVDELADQLGAQE